MHIEPGLSGEGRHRRGMESAAAALAGVGTGEDADELVLGMIHEGLKSRQGHLGSAGEENAHDTSLRADHGCGRSPRGCGITLPSAPPSFSQCEFRLGKRGPAGDKRVHESRAAGTAFGDDQSSKTNIQIRGAGIGDASKAHWRNQIAAPRPPTSSGVHQASMSNTRDVHCGYCGYCGYTEGPRRPS